MSDSYEFATHTDWPPRIAAPSWSGWADRTVTGRGYSRPLLGHGHPVSWLPYEWPAGDDRQVSSQDRRSVKLRVRPPPAGTHQCHRATSAGSGMMLTVKLTKSSSIDPQDTGLRASREPAMLGIRNDRQPHLDNTFVALPGSHLRTAHKHQNQAASRARYPALTRAQRRPGPAVRRECPGQVARHRARR